MVADFMVTVGQSWLPSTTIFGSLASAAGEGPAPETLLNALFRQLGRWTMVPCIGYVPK